MSHRTIWILSALIAVSTFVLVLRAEDKKPAAPAPAVPDLARKIFTVNLDGDAGAVVENAEFVAAGGRHFIVGTGVNMGNSDWREGARVWLPVDAVIQCVEFENIDEAKRAYEIAFQTPRGETPRRVPPGKPKEGL